VDRGRRGIKRSVAVDAEGIPLAVTHPKSLESLALGEGTLTSAMTTYWRKLLMARHEVVRVHALAIGDSVSGAKHPNLRGVGADVVA
jgi:hypothetical protein